MTREPGSEPDRGAQAHEIRRDAFVGALVDGRYRVIERIGAGGMGSVYRVEHLRLHRHFALKLLRPELSDEPGMLQRFERESRLAASIKSEHVVGIVDSGELAAGTPYFVMELGDSDLRRLLRAEGRLAPVRSANLGIDTCRGLAAAHANGLVHRDLKPENLLLSLGDDGREIIQIADFGVAKSLEAKSTRRGSLVGTVRYMAPEQVGLNAAVGPPTDIYALGVILYECLAGVVPFDEETTERTLYRIMTDAAEPLRSRCPDLPRGLAEAVDRALSRDPSARHPSARAFIEALMPFAGVHRPHTTGGRIVTSLRSPPSDTDTSPGFDDAPVIATAASGHSGTTGRWPWSRSALIALVSALVAFGVGRLGVPRPAVDAVMPSAMEMTLASSPEPLPVSPSPAGVAGMGGPNGNERGHSPVPIAVGGPAAVGREPPHVERASQVPSAQPTAARSATGVERQDAGQRHQPPSLSFDPRNPYGP